MTYDFLCILSICGMFIASTFFFSVLDMLMGRICVKIWPNCHYNYTFYLQAKKPILHFFIWLCWGCKMLVHNAAIETIEELYILGSPCNFVDSIIDKINNHLQVQTLHIKYITFGILWAHMVGYLHKSSKLILYVKLTCTM